jgi:hypothetical protein
MRKEEEVRYCAPTTKTHTFGVVLNDWTYGQNIHAARL